MMHEDAMNSHRSASNSSNNSVTAQLLQQQNQQLMTFYGQLGFNSNNHSGQQSTSEPGDYDDTMAAVNNTSSLPKLKNNQKQPKGTVMKKARWGGVERIPSVPKNSTH